MRVYGLDMILSIMGNCKFVGQGRLWKTIIPRTGTGWSALGPSNTNILVASLSAG